ncbi:MAG: prepilin peptidase [Candidatus Omnitrophica bacterium]|nr:prepilin peptidase [Candidatus Omnitrophota bacterium]
MDTIQQFITNNFFFFTLFLFLFGACVGSFLNVCIYRLPEEGKSVVKPRSCCPSCSTLIRWYDNIPIFSYIILHGRCRKCDAQISPQYIIIEIFIGYLFVEFFILFCLSAQYVAYLYLTCSLLVVAIIDFRFFIIPDEISFAGMIVGCLLSLFFPTLQGTSKHLIGFSYALIGLVVGGGMIYLTGVIGDAIFKKESMGGGDVKLMAMIGAFLGWKYAVLTFFLAPFFGAIVGLYVKFVQKKDIIPYGPFLSFAALLSLFAGDPIIKRIIGDVTLSPWVIIGIFFGIVIGLLLIWLLIKIIIDLVIKKKHK